MVANWQTGELESCRCSTVILTFNEVGSVPGAWGMGRAAGERSLRRRQQTTDPKMVSESTKVLCVVDFRNQKHTIFVQLTVKCLMMGTIEDQEHY
jgi:hypothetical protein